jgi:hypothetical protein
MGNAFSNTHRLDLIFLADLGALSLAWQPPGIFAPPLHRIGACPEQTEFDAA